ncbi:MAG: helix-turn-helix domain-containing protein [Candidatus Eisenbacteria sp.]|nr:helix-turn-helix domain-containing protein [Candidatus Eisenbacteria bacterium]
MPTGLTHRRKRRDDKEVAGVPPVTDPLSLPYLLTVEEAAPLLRTTPKGVYCMHDRGKLPGAIRRGRRLLVVRDRLLQWIRESCASSPTGKER